MAEKVVIPYYVKSYVNFGETGKNAFFCIFLWKVSAFLQKVSAFLCFLCGKFMGIKSRQLGTMLYQVSQSTKYERSLAARY